MFVDIFYSLSFETQIFLITILLFTLVFHATYTPATAEKAPAFLTTLGIFGTFVGIAIGLLEFNTMDISGSVPKLIEGIKTAVWASAAGIFAALTIKMRDIEGFSKRKRPVKKAGVDELIEALRSVEAALKEHAGAARVVSMPLVMPPAAQEYAAPDDRQMSAKAPVQLSVPLKTIPQDSLPVEEARPVIQKPTEGELNAVRREIRDEWKAAVSDEVTTDVVRKPARKPEFEFKDGSHFEDSAAVPASKSGQF